MASPIAVRNGWSPAKSFRRERGPALMTEAQINPLAAIESRLQRAEQLARRGWTGDAERMETEAEVIFCYAVRSALPF